VQSLDEDAAEYVPERHDVQVDAPADENEPAEHVLVIVESPAVAQ
jgi:hypothetical protein